MVNESSEVDLELASWLGDVEGALQQFQGCGTSVVGVWLEALQDENSVFVSCCSQCWNMLRNNRVSWVLNKMWQRVENFNEEWTSGNNNVRSLTAPIIFLELLIMFSCFPSFKVINKFCMALEIASVLRNTWLGITSFKQTCHNPSPRQKSKFKRTLSDSILLYHHHHPPHKLFSATRHTTELKFPQ